ncbi:MAG: LytTR family DNA-binding domain-containing protein [Firmicutes bacterium]|nr:LytTR family DNA-binding domain-containing protein [Bacillota bacterium]MDD7602665.1 LytTR family DNA-binding domain-containing protein [Bacillota bacterium]MDY5855426.1 LytTR family DNA-binding domain-containing protein [Anaerovoracaceae bacterium]
MRKINVLVCDDQPEIVEQMKTLLLRYEDEYGRAMRILGVTSYDTAEDFPADLLFLDIEMPGRSGLSIRDELEKKSADSLIIFVTSHSEAVWDAFGRNVIGFFEKPMDYDRLCQLMKKFFDLYSIYETVNLEDGTQLAVGDIVWIQVKDIYSQVRLASGAKYTLRRSLSVWESMLPAEDFLRISDTCIVGCRYVARLEKKGVRLDDCEELFPFSTRRKKGCEEKYLHYCRKMARYGG